MSKYLNTLPEADIRRALNRLRRKDRLVAVNAPDVILKSANELLEASKTILGDEVWSYVLRQYPLYLAMEDAREERDLAWDKRCEECKHWRGFKYAEATSDAWCEKYTIVKITKPKPCPEFEEDE